MATTWIVAADSSRARFLQVASRASTPPKFLGALRKELDKEVEKLVVDELPKDLSWLSARELERYFAKGSGRAP